MRTMRAIEAKAPGGAEVLRVADVPRPKPAPGQVLIAVEAAGVNRPDVLQRLGLYPAPEGVTPVLGLEVCGEVAALGDGVGAERLGERVMALLPGGGYAEYAVCDARHALAVPDGLSAVEAAAFPETAFTVWTNVFEAGRLTEGERLLVHGATSGIGTMAGKMAGAFGAEAWGTAGSREKVAAAKASGYARCFDYNEEPWDELTAEAGGVDVVLDMVGGDYVARNLTTLRPRGRHVSIAFLRGTKAEIDVVRIMRGQLTLTGSTLRGRTDDEKARLAEEVRRHLLPKLANGELTPVIDGSFPLAEAADAHRRMEASEHVGKIVLTL